jgi:hypothetical protein
MKLMTIILGLVLSASLAWAGECSSELPGSRDGPDWDPRCESSCYGFCWGYYYFNYNYFNPLCADLCCWGQALSETSRKY